MCRKSIATILWKLILIVLIVCFISPAYALPDNALDFVTEELLPFLEGNDEYAILFAAELGISNGPEYARLYGERGMFGRLVMAESDEGKLDVSEFLPIVDDIRAEVERLLLNPCYTPFGHETGAPHYGKTEFSYRTFTDVMYLDYETCSWKRWPGEITALRIEHTTEYSGAKRYRCIAADGPIKFSILKINWR